MNIYVSNLDFTVTEQDIKTLFSQHGTVNSVKVVTDYNTGKSRGFAFVEMANDTEGQAAIAQLNTHELKNRAISVQVARPKEDRPGKNSFGDSSGGGRKW